MKNLSLTDGYNLLGVKFSAKKLKQLANDEKSGLKVCRSCVRTFQIKLKYIGNIISGIQHQLDATKYHYDVQWEGVVLDYKNIKIIAPILAQDKTLYDSTVAVTVSFDVYYLPFTISSIIRGVVTQVEDKQIVCLIHNVFHASVLRPHNKPFEKWAGSLFNINDTIEFRVTERFLRQEVPSVHGELLENRLKKMRKSLEAAMS